MALQEIEQVKDETIKKRLTTIFDGMKHITEALMDVLKGSYLLKLQVRDASVPDRVLWERPGELQYDRERHLIVPAVDGLPITITLEDLLKAFRSKMEVKELPVFMCWEFQVGEYKTLCYLPPVQRHLIIVSEENPIKLS